MPVAIYVLALAAFVVGTQSYVFSGLLSDMSAELNISIGTVGQLITAFAITSAIAAPLVIGALSRFDRKNVLIASLIGVSLVNLVTALLPIFEGLLLARIVVAVVSAAVMPTAGAIGASLVSEDKQGQALGIILSGLTIAFIAGVPFGTLVGGMFGWRFTFIFAAIVAILVIPPIYIFIPKTETNAVRAKIDWRVIKHHDVKLGLCLMGLSFIATYPIFAYIGPIITQTTQITGSGIGAMQVFIGLGSIGGLVLGGIMADRASFLPNMRIMFAALTVVLSLWVFLFNAGNDHNVWIIVMVAIAIFLTAAALIAPSPAIEKALVRADPEQSAFTLALNTSTIYLGQGIGAAYGGIILADFGYTSLGYASAIIAIIGFISVVVLGVRRKSN